MQIGNNGKFFKSTDVLNSFLTDVRKYPVPSVEEEERLFESFKNGDENAKDMIILGHLRFVYSLAKIYARDESEVIDYVNEGVIGLMTALNEFDPTKGYKFITYGVWYIRRQMNYYMLTKRDLISHSSQVGNVIKKADAVRQRYFAEYGVLPTNEQVKKVLMESFNLNVTKDEDMFETGIKSIDEDVSEDYTVEETSEYNTKTAAYNEYETVAEDEYRSKLLGIYLAKLPERMQKIVKMRYGIGYERALSSAEIADECGIDADRVDKICEHAILIMRQVPVRKAV